MSLSEEPILNRVANSPLKTFDLEVLYTEGPRMALDIAQWFEEGAVLREVSFRQALKNADLSVYQNAHVALYCSEEAILPQWTYALVTSSLSSIASTVVVGSLELLEIVLFERAIAQVDFSVYQGAPVILKGCAHKPVVPQAYVTAAAELKKVAKKLMYGEACSAVPL
ncbi:MAG: hypothetical protein RLZZ242_23 [Bacteroidota bacterium]|jgi:hypothetical protein